MVLPGLIMFSVFVSCLAMTTLIGLAGVIGTVQLKGQTTQLASAIKGLNDIKTLQRLNPNMSTPTSPPVNNTMPEGPTRASPSRSVLPPGFLRLGDSFADYASSGEELPKSNGSLKRGKRAVRSRQSHTAHIRNMTPLLDNASKNQSTHSDKVFEPKVMEAGLIMPSLGLVMEQVGSYMEYSGYIFIPTIYHMPHLVAQGLVGSGINCNVTVSSYQQDLIINLLKEKIGVLSPKRSGKRAKRFLETLVLGGAVAWNRASIWSIQDNIESLESHVSAMQNEQQIVLKSINTMIDNQHAIYHSVDRQARILREFLDKRACDELITSYFRDAYTTWLALAPNDFSRVVDGALSGKITTDLLPASDVASVLMKHPAMVQTAYVSDTSLLYELGKFSFHKVSYDPYPMVSGVMIFPRILAERSAALMRVYYTHFLDEGIAKILSLPDTLACKNKENCWSISPTSSREMLTLTLCPKQINPEFNMCINQLMTGKQSLSRCDWKYKTTTDLEVIAFEGGVLVSAGKGAGEIQTQNCQNSL